jgi:hypothetical protein
MNCRRFQQPKGLTFSANCTASDGGYTASASLTFKGTLSQFTERELACTELYAQARAKKISDGKSFLTLLSYNPNLPTPTDPVRRSSWCEACDFDVYFATDDFDYAWRTSIFGTSGSRSGTGFLESKIYWGDFASPENREYYNPKFWFASLFANPKSNYCYRNDPNKNACFVSWFPYPDEGSFFGPYIASFGANTTRPRLGVSSVVGVNIITQLQYD